MAHTVEIQTLVNGPRNLVLKIHIDGDSGTATELTDELVVDVSSYGATEVSIQRVQSTLAATLEAELIWDATTDVHAINIPDYDVDQDYSHFGGLINNAGAGKTGDILLTTSGLASTSLTGHIILSMTKRGG